MGIFGQCEMRRGFLVHSNEKITSKRIKEMSAKQKKSAFATLLNLSFKRKKLIWFSIIFSVLGAGLSLVPAFIVKYLALITEDITQTQDVEIGLITELILWAIVLFGLRWVFIITSVFCSHLAAFATLYDLRIAIANKLSTISMGHVSRFNSGTLKKIIQNDVERIELFIAHLLPDFAAAIATPIVSGIILFWIDWRLGLASISTLFVAVLFQWLMMRNASDYEKRQGLAHDRINSALVQFIQGITTIKSFDLSTQTFGQLNEAITSFRQFAMDVSRQTLPYWAIFQVGIKANILIMLPLGGYLVIENSIAIEDLLLGLMMGMALVGPMMRILFMASTIKHIQIGLDRIDDILSLKDQKDIVYEQYGAINPVLSEQENIISFKNVSFSYDKNKALDDVSVDIKRGSSFAIIGKSGSGKSTMVNLLARFWEADHGHIYIDGQDITQIDPKTLNQKIAFVFQDNFLFNDTIEANLRYANPEATHNQIMDACKKAQAHEFIAKLPLGYNTVVGERATRLSGGERQRLSIARLILRDAPIIILDEAVAYTDQLNSRAITRVLNEIAKDKTIITIAHRLETIKKSAKVILLDKGKILVTGDHENLIQDNSAYRSLWEIYEKASQLNNDVGETS